MTVTVTSPDRTVLVELYDALGGSNWMTNTNWKTDADLDRWFGVTTNGDERVVRLELPDNGLSGSIPAGIGRLEALETLDLDSNRIAGAFPPELGDLSNLESLWLSDNALSGTIPPELGRLGNLAVLSLADNAKLAGALTEPMTALTNLQELLADGSGLCAPTDNPRIRAWLDRIPRKEIASCRPAAAYLTQAVQLREKRDTVPLVAAEGALLRVFLVAARKTDEHIPGARARFYVGGPPSQGDRCPREGHGHPHRDRRGQPVEVRQCGGARADRSAGTRSGHRGRFGRRLAGRAQTHTGHRTDESPGVLRAGLRADADPVPVHR